MYFTSTKELPESTPFRGQSGSRVGRGPVVLLSEKSQRDDSDPSLRAWSTGSRNRNRLVDHPFTPLQSRNPPRPSVSFEVGKYVSVIPPGLETEIVSLY